MLSVQFHLKDGNNATFGREIAVTQIRNRAMRGENNIVVLLDFRRSLWSGVYSQIGNWSKSNTHTLCCQFVDSFLPPLTAIV